VQSYIDVAKGWLQWAIDWQPHWIVQGLVVVFLVWILIHLGGWVAKKIAATVRRKYESFNAEFERQVEEKREGIERLGKLLTAVELGGINAVALMIRLATLALTSYLTAATVLIIMAVEHEHMPVIVKTLGMAVFIASLITGGRQSTGVLVILQGIESAERKQREKLARDGAATNGPESDTP